MNVAELIDTLSDMNPDSEVKLAIQPTWAFQHSFESVVEVHSAPDLQWGVWVKLTDNDEEFNEAEANTRQSARELYESMDHGKARNLENGIADLMVVGAYKDDFLDENTAMKIEDEAEAIVYLAECGQDCYLPEAAAAAIGWTRR